ncbi:MAG: BON domain-containing protein [Longimicrobiaceae bacterium]
MARYDANRGASPYDRPFQQRRGPGGGGYGWSEADSFRGGRERGYDAGMFSQGEGASQDGGIYGPARYGLGPYHDRLRQRTRPDEELREEVEEALFYDTWVDAEAITVEVKDGIVTLSGELPDYEEIRYAVDDVWDVDGVRGVRAELTVRSG